jgi:hypothetical protein
MLGTTCGEVQRPEEACAPFVWLISHQPAVLFSQNKPATSNQPAILFLSEQISTSHQPTAERTGRWLGKSAPAGWGMETSVL